MTLLHRLTSTVLEIIKCCSFSGSTWDDSSSPPISSRLQLWHPEAERPLCMCARLCVNVLMNVCTLVYAILIISKKKKISRRGFPLPSTPQSDPRCDLMIWLSCFVSCPISSVTCGDWSHILCVCWCTKSKKGYLSLTCKTFYKVQ